MKKLPILTMLFLANLTFAQINLFQFEGVKDYPNGNRIAYFAIEGIKENPEAFYVQTKMINNTDVFRFFIYEGETQRRCMIECLSAIDEKTITERINTLIANYIKEKELYSNKTSDFPELINTGNPQEDNAKYDEAKRKWIEENPEKYNQLAHPNGIITNESKKCK